MALAPSWALLGVPSSSMSMLSTRRWSVASKPTISSAMAVFTLSTAVRTPLPKYSPPSSRSSTASYSPVDAPEGTAARPTTPDSSSTSTSTVGLPRESRICLAVTSMMVVMGAPSRSLTVGGRGDHGGLGGARVGEDVRVTGDERDLDVVRHAGRVAGAGLAGHEREQHDWQQRVV